MNKLCIKLGVIPRGPCECRRTDLDRSPADLDGWMDEVRAGMAIDRKFGKTSCNDEPHFLILMLDADDYLAKDASCACGSLEELPISDQLFFDFARWGADYGDIGRTMFSHEILQECDPNFPRNWFNQRGGALIERLREELGSEWTIEHSPLVQWGA